MKNNKEFLEKIILPFFSKSNEYIIVGKRVFLRTEETSKNYQVIIVEVGFFSIYTGLDINHYIDFYYNKHNINEINKMLCDIYNIDFKKELRKHKLFKIKNIS